MLSNEPVFFVLISRPGVLKALAALFMICKQYLFVCYFQYQIISDLLKFRQIQIVQLMAERIFIHQPLKKWLNLRVVFSFPYTFLSYQNLETSNKESIIVLYKIGNVKNGF